MKKYLPLCLLICLSCDDRKVNTTQWKEELKTHQFVKVTDGEIAADTEKYAQEVLDYLDSINVLTNIPDNKLTTDSVINSTEQRFKGAHKVKLCLVKQDNLDGCYPSVTIINDKNTIKELWEANENSAAQNMIATDAAPQFLLDGFFVLKTYPVIKENKLSAMWCMLFERKNIVLNRIE